LLKDMQAAALPERIKILLSALRNAIAGILKIAEDRISPDQAFESPCLDSLMVAELEAAVRSDWEIALPLCFSPAKT
jgi:acyl carrier protein